MCCSRRRWETGASKRSELPNQFAASAARAGGLVQGTRLERALQSAILLVLGGILVFAAYMTFH